MIEPTHFGKTDVLGFCQAGDVKRVFIIAILLSVALISIAFTVANFGDVTVYYVFGEFKAPLSLIIYVALIIGLLTGFLINSLVLHRLKKQQKATRKQMENYVAELKKLRSMPLKDLV